MKHIDLFSGIGGFALAADTVFENVNHTFVEIDPFCQAILKKHWPESEIHYDIRQFITDTASSRLEGSNWSPVDGCTQVDILTGGFPCQPFSQAGKRKGTSDDRYLWPEMFRVIQLYQPQWVIAENVRGLTTWNEGMVLEQVCTDLESENYEVQPLIIPACGVNAPHRRERVWIIAHAQHDGKFRTQNATVNSGLQPKSETREKLSIDESKGVDSLRKKKTRWDTLPDNEAAGLSTNSNNTRGGESEYDDHQDRSESNSRRQEQPLNRTSGQSAAITNTDSGRWDSQSCISPISIEKENHNYALSSDFDVTNTRGAGLEEARACEQTKGSRRSCNGYPDWSRDWQEVAFATCNDGVADGIPRRLGNTTISSTKWRREALKAYGNAIVPQVAMEIMRAIETY